ncbi:(2Fe-2S)-binding protein [Bradyrhizobium tropiciagri]|uniref:(2Fe-2S)-binding protein n=1 Tax=Bradyrhizobium tropiciagri TaxID=312253 RepID=UPI001BA57FE6|nr:(2Fe-2S)-binding protein [Bradyrhizobium tropiciagri]MBR0898906.1 (2Fe-2S)-binding protein [Bradyrhizobium tropiciagri]
MTTQVAGKCALSLFVNGRNYEAVVESRQLLVHFLRENLHLTGTHIGCDTSQCGACTILVDGQAVKSCTMFAVQADGRAIVTIEGVSQAGLNFIQQAFVNNHALQCGYCTPGFVMAAHQIIDRYKNPTEEQIREQLDGNICRCTGYASIVRAIAEAAKLQAEHE